MWSRKSRGLEWRNAFRLKNKGNGEAMVQAGITEACTARAGGQEDPIEQAHGNFSGISIEEQEADLGEDSTTHSLMNTYQDAMQKGKEEDEECCSRCNC